MSKERIQEIKDRLEWMQENLEGCDWCCGGGDEEWEELTEELSELESKADTSL